MNYTVPVLYYFNVLFQVDQPRALLKVYSDQDFVTIHSRRHSDGFYSR